MHESNAVIGSVELIPLGQSDLSPMLENVKIKVFYLGHNRNGSYIDKSTALNMAKTLRGCPIVGCFKEEKNDFIDHGEVVTIDDQGVHFNCVTRPYGFVDLNAEIWFENYIDLDDFGNAVEHTYLVTQGVVWSEQYPEIKESLKEGRPQSMELDEKTLKGRWSKDPNSELQIFIINDAIFSKLCILGEDVEPCFEGSSVTSPDISSSFSLEYNDFKNTLFTMMKDLKELTLSFNKEEGGQIMDNPNVEIQESTVEETQETIVKNSLETEDKSIKEDTSEIQNITEEFTKKTEDDKEESENKKNNKDDEKDSDDKKEDEKDDKYSLLEQQFSELSEKYALLEKQNEELLAFKLETEDKAKDELINSFYMLSDEDKKSIIENKSKYSLDDIEKELSVICVRKKVSFENNNSETAKDEAPLTYNLNIEDENVPAWIKAVDAQSRNK